MGDWLDNVADKVSRLGEYLLWMFIGSAVIFAAWLMFG